MRLSFLMAGVAAVTTFALLQAQQGESTVPAPKLETVMQKGSYLIGHNIGSRLREDSVDADLSAITAGLRDGLAGKDPAIDKKEVPQVMEAFQKEVQAKAGEKQKVEGEKNLKAAKAFLAENAKKPGVKTTPSGLQYEIVTQGDGASPKVTDTVSTHYKGTLLDGTVFDSSYERGEPAQFPVNGVIKGWVEALPMMKVSSKWKLYVPPDLGYGEAGAGGRIGPNELLVFEVELLGISE